MMNTIEKIRTRLTQLSPTQLDIEDDSARHAGHEGARGGGGHYFLTIVSPLFWEKPTVARHRMIYDALGEMMKTEIHALSIKAFSPEELQ